MIAPQQNARQFVLSSLQQGHQFTPWQDPSHQDRGFIGNLIYNSIINPATRLSAGFAENAAEQSAKMEGSKIPYKPQYLSNEDYQNYQNPWNVAKDAASLGSFIMPVGGGLKAALATGGMAGFGGTYGNNNLDDTLMDTAIGAATGGVLHGAGKAVGKGLSFVKNKVAPAVGFGARTAESTISKVPQFNIDEAVSMIGKPAEGVEGTFLKMQSKNLGVNQAKNIIDKPQVLVDNQRLLNYFGEENTDRGIQNAVKKVANARDGEIVQIAKTNPNLTFTPDNLIDENLIRVTEDIALNSGKSVTGDEVRNNLVSFMKQSKYGNTINPVTKLKSYSIEDLNQMAMDIKNELRRATPTAKSGPVMQAKQALLDNIESAIGEHVPNYYKYNNVMGSLYKSLESTGRKQLNAMNANTSGGLGKGFIGDMLPVKDWSNKVQNAVGKKGVQLISKTGTPEVSAATSMVKPGLIRRGVGMLARPAITAGAQIVNGTNQPEVPMGIDPAQYGYPEDMTVQSPDQMFSPDGTPMMGGSDQRSGILMIKRQIVDDLMSQTDAKGRPLFTKYTDASKEADAMLEDMGYSTKDATKQLPASALEQRGAAQSAIQQLMGLSKDLQSAQNTGPIMGRISGLNIFDPSRQALETQINTIARTIAKGIEGGKLTDQDALFYQRMMPSANDTKEVAAAKTQKLLSMLGSKISEIDSAYQAGGYSPFYAEEQPSLYGIGY